MSQTSFTKIVERLLEEKNITAEEAVTLLQAKANSRSPLDRIMDPYQPNSTGRHPWFLYDNKTDTTTHSVSDMKTPDIIKG